MRPIWKGHITFGLVNIPVTLYPAEQRSDLSLHMIDSRNHSRVRYERVNAETGEEVPWDQVVRGYEYDKGNYVLVNDEDLKRAAPEATKAVEIEAFISLSDIDPMYFERPYFLEPAKAGRKGYALLRETLRETGKAGIARVVIRTRQYLAALLPRGDVLLLLLLRYHAELRSPRDLDIPGSVREVGVSAAELKMARTLVDSMSGAWTPAEYRDEYRDALLKWIEQKVAAGEVDRLPEAAAEAEDAPEPINLMEALKRSLQRPEREDERPAAPARAASKSAGGKPRSTGASKRPGRKKAG